MRARPLPFALVSLFVFVAHAQAQSAPTISSLSTQSAVPAAPVTIFGTNFGASEGGGQVLLGTAYGTVLLWNDTRIVADVNSQSQSGVAQVFQNGFASNQFSFTVLPPSSGGPTISPAPNAYGWNNTAVTVTFCAVAANCSPPQTVTSEGAGQVISGTVFGNPPATVSVTLLQWHSRDIRRLTVFLQHFPQRRYQFSCGPRNRLGRQRSWF